VPSWAITGRQEYVVYVDHDTVIEPPDHVMVEILDVAAGLDDQGRIYEEHIA
jgi:hypothetical protein